MNAERAIELLSDGTKMPSTLYAEDELDEACEMACDALRLYSQAFQKTYSINAAIADYYQNIGLPMERLDELADADKAGRVIILPDVACTDADGEKALRKAVRDCDYKNNGVTRFAVDAIAEKLCHETQKIETVAAEIIKPAGFPSGKYYRTIYVDPPWPERGGGRIKRGADRHYPLMPVSAIKALPVAALADPEGCHLYLWATNNYLHAALECMEVWGFEYVTTITWMKDRMGLGQYYRGLTEHCLFGTTKKRLPYKTNEAGKRCQGVTGFVEAKGEHSRKPERMREMIEDVSYSPRIELFAREKYPGWDSWGNEI